MKNLGRAIWPVIGLVFLAIAIGAIVSATQNEGINAVLLIVCSVLIVCGALGATIKAVESWK
jgi:hypothetical protein